MITIRTNILFGGENIVERKSATKNNSRRQTQWDGLFVSEHAWDFDNDTINDSQPVLSADEQQAVLDMLIVACNRKCTVFIQSWQGRHFHYHRCTIQVLDWEQRSITYEESFEGRQLSIDMITSIHMLG